MFSPSIRRKSLHPRSHRRFALAVAAIAFAASSCAASAQTASIPESSPVMAASIPGVSPSISRVATGAETLHVVVGHSLFLNTKFRLHKVYVADPAILNSVTLTANQIIVTAMAPGISSLILLDEAGQAQSYVVSSDLDVQGLRTAINQAMRDDTVNVEGNGSRVILSGKVGSVALADTAVKLAGIYSKDVANSLTVIPEHPKQVRLKVRMLEIDRSKLTQMGINLFNPGGNTSFLASTTTSQYPSTSTLSASSSAASGIIGTLTTSNPLNFLLYSTKLNLGANIQDLESKQVLQILAEPTITTISGEKANFLAGGEFPFPVIQPGGGSGNSASVTIQFRPYGVKLEFTPIVNEDGTIRLKVAPEVSALDYTNAVTISGYTIPALSTRKAETEVELRSDQSFAISGLLDQRTTDILNKTPGAASIPIIGALFKSKNVNHSTTELIVIVTPTLVDPLGDTGEPAEPGLPIPTLNPGAFDKSLGKNRNPNPTPPPINPSPAPAPARQQSSAVSPAPAAPASSAPAPQQAIIVESSPSGSSAESAQDSIPLAPPAGQAPVAAAAQPAEATSASAPKLAARTPTAPPSRAASIQVPTKFVFDNPAATAADLAPPPPAAAPDTPSTSMVQIMALSHREDADTMVSALKRHGYAVAVNQDPHDSLLHLEVGPFTSKTDAEAMRDRLLHDGYNATVR